MGEHQVVVIGAGHAGVASALALKDRGIESVVLDEADQVGSSWRKRYDRLRLNTWRRYSQLPGRRYAKGTPTFPSREDVIANLERHTAAAGLDLRFGTRVDRLARNNGHWTLSTSGGEIGSAQVVVATGYEHQPLIPDWPGRQGFTGRLLHAHDYRNPEPFAGNSVLVVGPGCSGMEIAHDLAEGGASKVWLAVRTPPNMILREGPGGMPGDVIAVALLRFPSRVGDAVSGFGRRQGIGDLTEYGLPVPEEGIMSRLRRLGVAPAILDEEVVEAIKARKFEIVRGVESLDETGALLADGERLEPDAIISATGYRRGLEPLVGHLGVLDERGTPKARGKDPAAPGLRFIGFVPRPGGLGYVAKEAKRAAKAITRELRT